MPDGVRNPRVIEQSSADKLAFERNAAANGFRRVAGVDEAGRGPLAGPIVAAAVVLMGPAPGVDDSKRLTAAQRERLFEQLHADGHAIGVAIIGADEIDRHGIQCANYAAMSRAAAAVAPDFLLVDGFEIKGCATPQQRIVKGDRLSASIGAASIIAKVTRDRIMDDLARQYPGYGFEEHKGYGTAAHLDALRRLGPSPVHRMSFSPMADRAAAGDLFEESA